MGCVGLFAQLAGFIYLTYWELSWDVMEPIAYMLSLTYRWARAWACGEWQYVRMHLAVRVFAGVKCARAAQMPASPPA